MTDNTLAPISLLGTGAMGTALARAWLAAGHPVTVWNRTPSRAEPLAAEGATVVEDAAKAVTASRLVVVCLLDDPSVTETLDGTDLTGRDLVDLTTGTPAQGRSRATWAQARGARLVSGGIMAVPPMIGVPQSGAYVFYSGDEGAFREHREALEVAAEARYVGADAGHAALYDVALLSAMSGMFAGVLHAFALFRREGAVPSELAPMLVSWLGAMAPMAQGTAARLASGDLTGGVVSNLAMQSAASATLLSTAEEQGVSAELLLPYLELMAHRVADGHGDEDSAGLVDLLVTPGS